MINSFSDGLMVGIIIGSVIGEKLDTSVGLTDGEE